MPIGFHPDEPETVFADRERASRATERCHLLLDNINVPPFTIGTREEQLYCRLLAYITLKEDVP